jgi:hypothetical protein
MEWKPVYYKGLETNIEVTSCGRVRRVKKDWLISKRKNFQFGEVDFSKLKKHIQGYQSLGVQIKGLKPKPIQVQKLVAIAFLNHIPDGHNIVVDHIDSNKENNHIDNLRLISARENVSKERTKKSGLPVGVFFIKTSKKYITQITINNKQIYLGTFNTIEEASNAYQNKLLTLKN